MSVTMPDAVAVAVYTAATMYMSAQLLDVVEDLVHCSTRMTLYSLLARAIYL